MALEQEHDEPEFDPDEGVDEPEGDEPEGEEDEPEGEEPEGGDTDPEPEPEPEPRRVSRAQARIERQQSELRAARAEAADAKRATERLQQQFAATQQQMTQRQQQEQLANMDPVEREKFLGEQRLAGLQQQIQQQGWALQESMDKTNWTSKATSDPVAKRYTQRVEQRLMEMRAAGQTAPRESVYFFLLGQDMATKGAKAIPAARAAGKARVASARGEAPRGRGDASGQGRRADSDSIEALEARLGKAVF